MSTVLDRIVAVHRQATTRDPRSVTDLAREAAAVPPPRPFRAALQQPGMRVIAEIKRRSPSKGPLAPDLVPEVVAKAYESGGAAALSVLTDTEFFGGSPADLVSARAGCHLPVLRKDFTVDRRDVLDARIMGADAVLLIVAVLSQSELSEFAAAAADLGMAALVEVHTEVELERAMEAGADLIGVNQRDLTNFEVDVERAERLARRIPAGVVKVAESGIDGPGQVDALSAAGYDAVLVGEALVTAADPAAGLRRLTRSE